MTMGKENVKEPVPRDLPVVQTYVPPTKFLGSPSRTHETVCMMGNSRGNSKRKAHEQKERILELKRRYFEDYYSDNQYAVSIKEDTAYLCLHSPKTTKDTRPIRRIQESVFTQLINTAYSLLLNMVYRSSDKLRMTKVIKGEFEKLEDLKVKDVSLTCDTSLEVFNHEFNRLSRTDDDLFTYEVEISNITYDSNKDDDSEQRMSHEADDDMGHYPSDVAFTKWSGGDDEVELTDEEFSNNEDEVAEVFRIDTNIFDFETPMCKTFKEFNYLLQIDPDLLTKDIEGFKTYDEYKDDWIYEWNKDIPWVDEKPWTDAGVWTEIAPVKHYCKPFNYKTGYSKWPTCSWKNDGYCNGGNLPGAYIVRNLLHYQDYEWYESLKDSELKEQALRNKAIMEGLISDDESSNDGWRRWESHEITYHDHDEIEYENETHDERQELCETHELSMCNMRRFKMIKYSFGQDEEYVAVKEDEYDNLARTSGDACRAYQEIFCMIDEGWMVTRAE
ncbi:hypothetical protein Tco_1546219 [Tanacetum coccineum]